jgi:hypothetical protein
MEESPPSVVGRAVSFSQKFSQKYRNEIGILVVLLLMLGLGYYYFFYGNRRRRGKGEEGRRKSGKGLSRI